MANIDSREQFIEMLDTYIQCGLHFYVRLNGGEDDDVAEGIVPYEHEWEIEHLFL